MAYIIVLVLALLSVHGSLAGTDAGDKPRPDAGDKPKPDAGGKPGADKPGFPSSPSAVTVANYRNGSVTLGWEFKPVTNNNNTLTNYEFNVTYFEPLVNKERVNVHSLTTKTRNATLSGLNENNIYSAYVQAINLDAKDEKYARGVPSVPVNFVANIDLQLIENENVIPHLARRHGKGKGHKGGKSEKGGKGGDASGADATSNTTIPLPKKR